MSAFAENSDRGIYRERPAPYDPRRRHYAVVFTPETPPAPSRVMMSAATMRRPRERPEYYPQIYRWWAVLESATFPPGEGNCCACDKSLRIYVSGRVWT